MSCSGPQNSMNRANGPAVWRWALLLVLVAGLAACAGKDETAQSPPAAGQQSAPAAAAAVTGESEEVLSLDQPLEAIADRPGDAAEDRAGTVERPAEPTTAGAVSSAQSPAPVLEKTAPSAQEAAGAAVATGVTSGESRPYCLQLGSFRKREHAQQRVGELAAAGLSADIVTAEVQGQTHYRVWIRSLASKRDAESLGERLQDELGFSYLVRQE